MGPQNLSSVCRRAQSAPAAQRWPTFFLVLLFAAAAPPVLVGDDHNPIGVTGVFEGVITTGGAYNVLNHSASRQIDDIVVPGSMGKYPLKMTRYYNSRRTSSYLLMGPGWSHEYSWTSSNDRVDYPNGNVWDNHCTGEWGLRGSLGVSDGPTTWNGYPAFCLADGGTIVFGNAQWTSVATKIVDPYGQETNITLDNAGRITQVTEPGGRYLKFFYQDPDVSTVLTKVEAHGLGNATITDSVVYNYQWIIPGGQGQQSLKCLTQADYSDTQHAYYTYQEDNAPHHPGPICPCSIKAFPLVRGCDDVRYHGPMRRIAYQYPDQGAHGAITLERYWDGVRGNEGGGAMVSKILPAAPSPLDLNPPFDTTYTETRGDGPTRTFTYTPLHLGRRLAEELCPVWHSDPVSNPAPQQFLESYTDFKASGNSNSSVTTLIGM